ncbi:lamina-associated polypeptide 2-like isoform X2 [Xenopus laevis]|uniref:Lamina-associated polypeptide 2-like isoform X2 n=1 Tax=Xenopus laevis TaxID=8355 RepID=A0A8J1LJ88_XENLA|nr:lamina-associated polypeptide 2-like isoform X2 [Xenopus laevis]
MEPAALKRAAAKPSGDSTPAEDPPSKRRHGKEGSCRACDNPVLKGKKLCRDCLDGYASREEGYSKEKVQPAAPATVVDQAAVMKWIKEAVGESMKQHHRGSASKPSTSAMLQDSSSEGEYLSSTEEDKNEEGTFDTKLVPSLIKAIRQTLSLEDQQQENSSKSLFVKKRKLTFPVHPEIKDLMSQEWKTYKKTPVETKLSVLYPFLAEDMQIWDNPPSVDAPVAHLSKKTALPIDDVSALKHPMDRRMEIDLKRAYMTAGATCKPAVAIVSVAKAMSLWVDNLEQAVREESQEENICEALADIKKAAEFCLEAAVDISRLSARSMAYNVAARRALWLRTWYADTASKSTLCRLPFEGGRLFGKSLDELISKSSGGKSTLLPQTKRPQEVSRRQYDRYPSRRKEEAKAYRPGREYRSNWRSGQTGFFRFPKGKNAPKPQSKPQ